MPNIFEIFNNKSNIPEKDLKRILELLSDNYFVILARWKEYFKGQEIRFYC